MKLFYRLIGVILPLAIIAQIFILEAGEGGTIHHPLGDNNIDVYTFIGRFLEDNTETMSPEALQNEYDKEKRLFSDPSLKPHIACAYEGEMAGLLRVLLLKNELYEGVAIYRKDGLILATSGMRDSSRTFKERPQELRLGYLTHEILSGPRIYIYIEKGQTYTEIIKPIYNIGHCYDTDSKDGNLVGYLSYIYRQSQSSSKSRYHKK